MPGVASRLSCDRSNGALDGRRMASRSPPSERDLQSSNSSRVHGRSLRLTFASNPERDAGRELVGCYSLSWPAEASPHVCDALPEEPGNGFAPAAYAQQPEDPLDVLPDRGGADVQPLGD